MEIPEGASWFARARHPLPYSPVLTAPIGAILLTVPSFEFTDVDRTASAGVSLKGKGWGREGDTIGLAGVINGASAARKAFLNAGGLGILVGDGQLPRPGDEHIVEAYYNLAPTQGINLTADFQLIGNPAYNRDRGPVVVLGARLHGQF